MAAASWVLLGCVFSSLPSRPFCPWGHGQWWPRRSAAATPLLSAVPRGLTLTVHRLIRVSWAPCQRRFLRSALGGSFWPQAPSSASSRWCYLPPGKLVAPRWPILVCAASPPNVPGLEGAPGLSLLVGSFTERWVLCHHGRAVLWRRISTPEPDQPAALSAGSHNCASSPQLAACLSDELELLSPTAPTERLS